MLTDITPVLLTFNEAPNIGRTLAMLDWARDIVIVDSFSSDDTVRIARSHAQVRVFQREFDSHSGQWNFAVHETGIRTEWVLALDADYVLSPELVDELRSVVPASDVAGFETAFRYLIWGHSLRGTVYQPVTTLYRRERARYEQDGHTQRVRVAGRVERLGGVIRHDDRKPLGHWCAAQNRYMQLEAKKLSELPSSELGAADRLRLMVFPAPFVMFFYCAFVKGNILDGKPGLYYLFQRTLAEMLLSLHLLQLRLVPK